MKRFFVIFVALSIACDAAPTPTQGALTPDQGPDKGRAADAGNQAPDQAYAAAAATKPRPPVVPPVTAVAPSLKTLQTSLKDSPAIGQISGEIFGHQRPIRALLKTQCENATVIQFVYEAAKGAQWLVSTPVRIKLFELATNAPVTYREGPFEFKSHITQDDSEGIKGNIGIFYGDKGERTYLEATFDGAPIQGILPPRLSTKKSKRAQKLPTYPECSPSGYFRATIDGQEYRGLTRVENLAGRGAPLIRLQFSKQDALEFLIIPPKPNQPINMPAPLPIGALLKKGATPAAFVGNVIHLEKIIEDDREATSANLGFARDAGITEGTVLVNLERSSKKSPWGLKMSIHDLKITDIIDGALSGATISKLEIVASLADVDDATIALPPAPDWWKQ